MPKIITTVISAVYGALQELANNDEEQLTPEDLYDAINECNPGIA